MTADNVQSIFQRYEIKFLLNRTQRDRLMELISCHMIPDLYPHSSIRNIYYDTDNFRLARRSLDKPVYKEKLRVRCYTDIGWHDPVFVELKKKYQSVVYKRRIVLPRDEAEAWLAGEDIGIHSQIAGEIEYFRDFYTGLAPKVFLSYERDSFRDPVREDFRLTLDRQVRAREDHLTLTASPGGVYVTSPADTLMEVKTAGGIPLWLSHFLNEEGIRQTSISKYGSYYRDFIFPSTERKVQYA
ncbi:MAG: polyphosphate polymerase domain-containing protein [Lachnospiraceae bacterium]|nr:polyphosphate polymerase domain-containing protein [Lachnospiraceae bacterium]